MNVEDAISAECQELERMLIAKNRAYGNSFAEPINIFSKVDARSQLYVRIDDKLNRLAKGHEYANEDTVMDLIGYLVLLRVLNRMNDGKNL